MHLPGAKIFFWHVVCFEDKSCLSIWRESQSLMNSVAFYWFQIISISSVQGLDEEQSVQLLQSYLQEDYRGTRDSLKVHSSHLCSIYSTSFLNISCFLMQMWVWILIGKWLCSFSSLELHPGLSVPSWVSAGSQLLSLSQEYRKATDLWMRVELKNKYVVKNECFGFVLLESVFPNELERKIVFYLFRSFCEHIFCQ